VRRFIDVEIRGSDQAQLFAFVFSITSGLKYTQVPRLERPCIANTLDTTDERVRGTGGSNEIAADRVHVLRWADGRVGGADCYG
jgi:hypothetical protein